MFKRIQPRARGTAFQIKRRMAHIHVTLSDPLEDTFVPPAPAQTAGTTTSTIAGTPTPPVSTPTTGEPTATTPVA